MRSWLVSLAVLACSAVALAEGWGIPPGASRKALVVRGSTISPEGQESLLVGSNESITFESCTIRPGVGMPRISVEGGKVVLRGCLLRTVPGLRHLSFHVSGGGSIILEECLLTGFYTFFTDSDGLGKGGASIRLNRCRFEIMKMKNGRTAGEVSLHGAGISFSGCDLEGLQGIAAMGLRRSLGASSARKAKGAGSGIIVDARNCWWGEGPVEEISKRIKDSSSGYSNWQGPSNAKVLFMPTSKCPNTTKLKPPEPKAEPSEKKSGDGKKKSP